MTACLQTAVWKCVNRLQLKKKAFHCPECTLLLYINFLTFFPTLLAKHNKSKKKGYRDSDANSAMNFQLSVEVSLFKIILESTMSCKTQLKADDYCKPVVLIF